MTNTRAYYRILQGQENPDFSEKLVSDYIILVDGVTTFATRTGWQSSSPYRTSDGNIGSTITGLTIIPIYMVWEMSYALRESLLI